MYTFTVTDEQIRSWLAEGATSRSGLCPLSAALKDSLPTDYHAQLSLAQPSGATIYGYASPDYDAHPVAMYQPTEADETAACEFIYQVDSHIWPERRTFTYRRVY